MPAPSVLKRDALRAALRAHSDAAESVLNGRAVSNLTVPELIEAVNDIGLDAARIMQAAVSAAPIITVPAAPDTDDTADTETDTADNPADDTAPSDADAIASEVAAVRGAITSQGFGALDAILTKLVTDARKPPVTIEVPVPATSGQGGHAMPVVYARPSGQTAPWSKLFGVRGEMGKRVTELWDGAHPDTPAVNPRYVWPQPATGIALSQIARKRNVYMYGAAGTGKTEWAQQLAARTGRPFALISCDSATDGPTLVGMTVPAADGAVTWQDGQLTRAIQTPGCVICLDEPSIARPGALFAMQNVLANRVLFIAETGARVKVAKGVIFLATDNTNGTGGGGRRGFTDTNRLNAAFLDRFGVRVRFDFMPADRERDILASYTGCTPELAELLVTTAAVTRAAADNQTLTSGIGFRRLLSWAELLTDGVSAADAFDAAILNCAPEQDVETLRQQCLLAYDQSNVTRALNPVALPDDTVLPVDTDPVDTNPSAAGRSAAADFRG